MEIYLIRHGETDMNVKNRLQGRLDTHLNEKGKRCAALAGEFLKENHIHIDEVWTSPLQRTIETAEIATGMDRKDFRIENDLVEMSFGTFEGHEVQKYGNDYTHDLFTCPASCRTPEGAESFSDLLKRADRLLNRLFLYYKEHENEDRNLLLASHGAFSHALICEIKDIPLERFWETDIRNCAILHLIPGDDRISDFARIFDGFKRDNMIDMGIRRI